MDLSFRHDFWWSRLPVDPKDTGRVKRLVLRPLEDQRRLVPRMDLTPEGGIEGDRWALEEPRRPGAQVSLMRSAVLDALAEDEEHAALAGDNLIVELDLSEANLPVGARLAVGSAVLEVSPDIHRPCAKFHDRFGKRAAQRIARANRRGLRGRGVLCHVVEAGTIEAGDLIQVTRPR